jgi:hypothetical protein
VAVWLISGCGCQGVVRAVTDRTSYAPGDDLRIRVENRSGRGVQIPELTQHLQFFRRVGQAWVLQPDPLADAGEDAVLYILQPCHSSEVRGRAWPQLPEGEYRIGFENAWTTNPFVIGPKGGPSNGAEAPAP